MSFERYNDWKKKCKSRRSKRIMNKLNESNESNQFKAGKNCYDNRELQDLEVGPPVKRKSLDGNTDKMKKLKTIRTKQNTDNMKKLKTIQMKRNANRKKRKKRQAVPKRLPRMFFIKKLIETLFSPLVRLVFKVPTVSNVPSLSDPKIAATYPETRRSASVFVPFGESQNNPTAVPSTSQLNNSTSSGPDGVVTNPAKHQTSSKRTAKSKFDWQPWQPSGSSGMRKGSIATPSNELSNLIVEKLKAGGANWFLSSLSASHTKPYTVHPVAEHYKLKFETEKDELCVVLYKLFNSEIFENGLPEYMDISWNARFRIKAGRCRTTRWFYENTPDRNTHCAQIELAKKLVDRPERMRDTLLHEMCHAAAWMIDGRRDGHSGAWLKWVEKSNIRFPEIPKVTQFHLYN